jgi:predicted secreted Zn-dependent protease
MVRTEIVRCAGRLSVAAGVAISLSLAAAAEVRTSTRTQYYTVGGTSARTLVGYMRSNPYRGSTGDAVANIRPSYSLDVASRQSGGTCRPTKVTLNINFIVTVPRARSALDGATRTAWNGFVSFAKQHEEGHRRIYIQCGNAFVAKAERLSASNCATLQAATRKLLEVEKSVCEGRQRAYDRTEYGKVAGLALFKIAGNASRASR